MTKRELLALYHLALACPPRAVALEIGSYLGASTVSLAAGMAQVSGHLFCVDTWQNETMPEGILDTWEQFLGNTRQVSPFITPIRKSSEDLHEDDVVAPIHLVFIDGDHGYDAVRRDFERVAPWIAEDGTVAFHDCSNSPFVGVGRVLGEALATGEWMLAGCVDSLVWITPTHAGLAKESELGQRGEHQRLSSILR
jgi:predicted O-methyltransferase YrrM